MVDGEGIYKNASAHLPVINKGLLSNFSDEGFKAYPDTQDFWSWDAR